MTGTNLATIKEPRIRAKYGSSERENVSDAGLGLGAEHKKEEGFPEPSPCRAPGHESIEI